MSWIDPSNLNWLIDEAIPITPPLQRLIGDVNFVAGRSITRDILTNIDVLLVRSITPINQQLITGTNIRFVGSATAGIDHVDMGMLRESGIKFAYAPGSNATAVVEYVLASIAESGQFANMLNGAPVGIVGLGYVGEHLAKRLLRLNCTVIAFDPLRKNWPSGVIRADLDSVLSQPIVSLHANLHDQLLHPSRDLLASREASLMVGPQSSDEMRVLINAARGELISENGLEVLMESKFSLIFDTWPGEPILRESVLARCDWVSPHIAGHSIDAKNRASTALANAIALWAGVDLWSGGVMIEHRREKLLDVTDMEIAAPEWAIQFLLDHSVLSHEDSRLRTKACPDIGINEFDDLRRSYRSPGEWTEAIVGIPLQRKSLRAMAVRLGLCVENI